MHQLVVYVPEAHVENLKNALFEAGAGQIGNYSHCCWQSLGEGQFKPLAGSQPRIGKVEEVTQLNEYKVEMMLSDHCIDAVVAALKAHHPYETPAYHLTPAHTAT